ncbi:MAG: hypothetical protein HY778_06340 [Betaproteobacteria bacterium]|nr:hypothetical protein [Betaproteobacteria bacterium]
MLKNSDSDNTRSAPTMSRSRGQLAGAYAPGAFFTFEGGLGACISIPDRETEHFKPRISCATQNQILLRLNEAVSTWFRRAINCRTAADAAKYPIPPELCVDRTLLNDQHNSVRPIDRGRFIFVDPVKMGYAPAPLTFVCNACGRYRGFNSGTDFERKKAQMNSKCLAASERKCQWRQLDVIFVHWSGSWEPVAPGKYNWNNDKKEMMEPIRRCAHCHSEEFLLDTSSPSIGNWFFKCANPKCGHVDPNDWYKNDPETVRALRENFGARVTEGRMEPISYRASAAHYTLAEQFVDFGERCEDLLEILDPSQRAQFESFIAEHFGFGKTRPSVEEMEKQLKERGYGEKWAKYLESKDSLAGYKAQIAKMGEVPSMIQVLVRDLEKKLQEQIEGWFEGDNPILRPITALPVALSALIAQRDRFTTRYDPFRLAVEHEAMRRTRLTAARGDGNRLPFVRFTELDYDLAPKEEEEKVVQQNRARELFGRMGVATMGLIREFDLCRFSYGFTRVKAQPVIEKRQRMMPVKLNLFPTIQTEDGSKHPIYVIKQANEAVYVQLDEKQVYRWLQALKTSDAFDWASHDGPLGAKLVECAIPFGPFLSGVPRRGASSSYLYAYTLLHTFSHHIMKAIAEHSGLDLGSLGEYLFPADLAFVVYRNGTTMDLGNLSALWRNENTQFLHYLLHQKTLTCNSGSLCDSNVQNPGACPDCILVPETSCIAMNQLLSRSVLRGGAAPREDGDHEGQRIRGFFEFVNAGD